MTEFGRELSNLQNQLPMVRLGRAIRRAVQGPGRFDCSLRVTDGYLPGLGSRWRARSSAIEGDTLVHGSRRVRLRLLDQLPNPGGFSINAVCLVWSAESLDHDARLQIAFAPRSAELILSSALADGRTLVPDPTINDL